MDRSLPKETALKLLQKDWGEAKADGWTQTKMSEKIGISQAAFSQYLTGKILLNTPFLLDYSRVRKIDPSKVGVEIFKKVAARAVTLNKSFSTSGRVLEGITVPVKNYAGDTEAAFLVEVDEPLPIVAEGGHLVCQPLPCGKNDLVFAVHESGSVRTGYLRKIASTWFIEAFNIAEPIPLEKSAWTLYKVTGTLSPENDDEETF